MSDLTSSINPDFKPSFENLESEGKSIPEDEKKTVKRNTSLLGKLLNRNRSNDNDGESTENRSHKSKGSLKLTPKNLALLALSALTLHSSHPGIDNPSQKMWEYLNKRSNITRNSEKDTQNVAETYVVDITSESDSLELIPHQAQEAMKENGYPSLGEMLKSVPSQNEIIDDGDAENYFYENLPELKQIYGEKIYPAMLFTIVMLEKKDHGKKVSGAIEKSNLFYGKQESPKLFSLQEAYRQIGIEPFSDEWENHGLRLSLKAEALIPLFKKIKEKSSAEHNVFNLSWQLGAQEVVLGKDGGSDQRILTQWMDAKTKGEDGKPLFFVFPDVDHRPTDGSEQIVDGKPMFVFEDGSSALPALTKEEAEKSFDRLEAKSEQEHVLDNNNPVSGIMTRDAYRRESVKDNIQEIIKLANEFPNDFFVLAAGNNEDDLRSAPQLPKNIIIVGEWRERSIKSSGLVYGADIYIDNSKFGLGRGSSFSAPFISATIENLLKQGVPFQDIKLKLNALCDRKQYRARIKGDPNSTLENANVLDEHMLQKKLEFEF